jgi:hypothetical protein
MSKQCDEFNPRKATKKELIKEYEALMDICEELQIKRRKHRRKQHEAEDELRERHAWTSNAGAVEIQG